MADYFPPTTSESSSMSQPPGGFNRSTRYANASPPSAESTVGPPPSQYRPPAGPLPTHDTSGHFQSSPAGGSTRYTTYHPNSGYYPHTADTARFPNEHQRHDQMSGQQQQHGFVTSPGYNPRPSQPFTHYESSRDQNYSTRPDHYKSQFTGGAHEMATGSRTEQYRFETPPSQHKQYSGPVLPSSQVKGHRSNSRDEPLPYSSSQTQYMSRPGQYGTGNRQTQYGGTSAQNQHGGTTQYGGTTAQNQYGGTSAQTQYGGASVQTQYGGTSAQNQYSGSDNSRTHYGGSGAPTQYGGNPQSQHGGGNTQYGGGDPREYGNPSAHYGGGPSPRFNQYSSGPRQDPYPPGQTGGRFSQEHYSTPQYSARPDEYQYQRPAVPTSQEHRGSVEKQSSDNRSPTATVPKVEDEIVSEIERHNEAKAHLIQEVAHLEGQKKLLQEEVRVLREEEKQLSESVATLQSQENTLKIRMAQCQQNLDLMNQLEMKKKQKQNQTEDPETTKQLDRIKELEITLKDRESEIKKREMELQTEADILYQRNKELTLKEYDMRNATEGQPTQRHLDQDAKEREIHFKQLELDERENSLNSREQSLFSREADFQNWERKLKADEDKLKAEEEKLEKWHKTVQSEDKRAQDNMLKASKMFDEAKQLESQILGAAAAVGIEEQQRIERAGTIDGGHVTDSSNPVSISVTSSTPTSAGPASNATPNSAVSFPHDSVDDETFARYMAMELNKELFDEDAKLVRELSMRETPEPVDDKKELRLALGLGPDASEEEVEEKIRELQQ